MSFEFGRPLPAAEMRLKCCSTQVLDCKGVYCSAHNAAVPSGPGHPRLGVRRTGPEPDEARHCCGPDTAAAFLAPGVVAESAPEASPASSSSLAAPGPLSSLSSSSIPRRRRQRRPRCRRRRPRRPRCRCRRLRRRRARRRFSRLQYPEQTQ
jgi:hypothetical protein